MRNIVLLRPVNSMIEFKQIIGRGTRLYDGKDYFTIYDFVKAHHHFSDPEWDGEPIEPEVCAKCNRTPASASRSRHHRVISAANHPASVRKTLARNAASDLVFAGRGRRCKLADGKARTIQHMMVTSFWHPDGTPMSAQQFMEALFGKLPEFFKDEDELRDTMERAGHAPEVARRAGRKGLRQGSTERNAEDHRRGEKRPVRRAGACRLCPANRSPAKSGRTGRWR